MIAAAMGLGMAASQPFAGTEVKAPCSSRNPSTREPDTGSFIRLAARATAKEFFKWLLEEGENTGGSSATSKP